jgi:hypothetical protein
MGLQSNDRDEAQQLLIDEYVNAKLFDSLSYQSILEGEEKHIHAQLQKPNFRHQIAKKELLAIYSGLIAWPGSTNEKSAVTLWHPIKIARTDK